MVRSFVRFGGLGAAAFLALAACSDDSDTTIGASPSETPHADASTRPTDPTNPGNPTDAGTDASDGGDAATDPHATTLSVLAPIKGAIETRRLLRATVADDDGIAKASYTVNGGAPIVVTVTGNPKSLVVKAALAIASGDNEIVVTVEDTLGEKTTATVPFRYGAVTAGGGSHSGAIVSDELYVFGRNNVGQLGLDPTTTTSASSPTKLVTTAVPSIVAFNQNSSLFVDKTGGVWVWGENSKGQLGLGDSGTATRRSTPTVNPSVTNIVAAAVGFGHTLVLDKDGVVKAWGTNDVGQVGVVGDGTAADFQVTPVVVAGLPNDIVKILGGSAHSLALTASGDVWAWGRNEYGNLATGALDEDRHPTPTKVANLADVVDIANGRDHILAVKADGSVVSWGLGASGQLGYGDAVNGDFISDQTSPRAVTTTGDGQTPIGGIATVFANGNTSFALGRDGKLWGWGEDGNGTLAQGGAGGSGAAAHKAGFAIRAAVYSLSGPNGKPEYLDERAKLVGIAVGALHVVAKTDKNEIYTWGWSTNGTLGIPDFPAIWRQPTPALVTFP